MTSTLDRSTHAPDDRARKPGWTGRRRGEPALDAFAGIYIEPDTGCNLSPSCLHCPFPVCKYDLSRPNSLAHDLRVQQQKERLIPMVAKKSEYGTARAMVEAAAQDFGVSARTIYRRKKQ